MVVSMPATGATAVRPVGGAIMAASARDGGKFELLFGPYRPPDLQPGDRAWCLLRDCLVVVTRWSDGRISWPLCHGLEANSGASGFLVDDEFARAIRSESAAAIGHWWG